MNFFVSSKTKQTIRLIFWIIFAVIIGIFVASLFFKSGKYEASVSSKENTATVVQVIPPEPDISQAQYFYVNKNTNGQQPSVSSKAYLVGDLNTGEVILAKNQDQKYHNMSWFKHELAFVFFIVTRLAQPAKHESFSCKYLWFFPFLQYFEG